MATRDPVLQVKDLATYYYLGDKELKAVDGVSFNIDAKRTLGLAGESGCGKTTTAYSLMRILAENGKITRGSVNLGGIEGLGVVREAQGLDRQGADRAVP